MSSFGAQSGSRTHTTVRSEDFKSSVYTIPPSGQRVLYYRDYIVLSITFLGINIQFSILFCARVF